MADPRTAVIDVDGLQALIDLLTGDGWKVVGPTVRDGAITHNAITSVADLPRGVGDEQDGARYRLRDRDDDALFGYAVGPQSWKQSLFPAHELLRRVGPDQTELPEPDPVVRPLALLGVRSCDLRAIAIHDRVLRDREYADSKYAQRREQVFVVAVACGYPSGTCFCASMGTGPGPDAGFDLALTELLEGGHRFLVTAGNDRGAEVLNRLPAAPVSEVDQAAADAVVTTAASRMGRHLDTTGIRDLLVGSPQHPQWDDVADRCLACTNCTMVCPTCFCTTVTDHTALATGTSERWREWDSCFTSEYSHLHGGSVRESRKARYRQWATHKLATWHDQFGSSGCVGCGRCIAWCPAAIDITAEVAAIRATTVPDATPATPMPPET